MYKKLILTFTLAAGLSVLPNAFAAPSTKPGPAPKPKSTTNTQFKDSIDVLADFKKGRRPPPGRYGEDSATVLAWKKSPPKGRHSEDSTIV